MCTNTISAHDRTAPFFEIFNEIGEIGKIAAVQRLSEFGYRLALSLRGYAIMEPLKKDERGIWFQTVWTSKEASGPGHDLKIYPMLPADEPFCRGSDYAGVSWARYNSLLHEIVLNMSFVETLRFRAVAFIHELGHALCALQSGRAFSGLPYSDTETIAEEVEMRTFDYKIVAAIGGPAYQHEFERGVYQTKKIRRRKKDEADFASFDAYFEGKGSVLDNSFGAVSDSGCRAHRDFLFKLFCDLAAADQNLDPASAMRFKYNIIAHHGLHGVKTVK